MLWNVPGHTSVRVKNGLRSNTYKPVDYDGLRELANQKRLAGQASLFKVKEIHQVKPLYNTSHVLHLA